MKAYHLAAVSLALVLGASSMSAQSAAAKDTVKKKNGGPLPTVTAILKCGNDSLFQCTPTKAAKATPKSGPTTEAKKDATKRNGVRASVSGSRTTA